MPLGYLDTSPLMRWVEADVPTPRPRDVAVAHDLEGLLGSPGLVLALSELTLLEFRSNVSKDWRTTNAGYAQFDAAWAQRSNVRLMEKVANREILVVPEPVRAAEHAATLVDLATADHSIALGTWDAIHLITASAWAERAGETVSLYTTDDGFQRFVGRYPEFATFVQVMDLNP